MVPAPRCCVLGATGFIGGQVARAALEAGWSVRGLRRRPGAVGALEDVAGQMEWVQADLEDLSSLTAGLRGCSLVFHAAAYYPTRGSDPWVAVRHGVTQIRNVLTAARQATVERVVYTSSLSTVGPPGTPHRLANEDDLYTPGSVRIPYFEVKWAMEQEAMRACSAGLPVVVVIPAAVFGPGDVKPTTSSLLLMVARRWLRWYIEGMVNVVDGREVAAGHILAAQRGQPGQRYILGGHNLTIQEMLSTMALAAGVPPPGRALPTGLLQGVAWLAARFGLPSAGQIQAVRHWQGLDTSRARQELGLPPPRPFAQTCQDTLEWFRAHGYLS